MILVEADCALKWESGVECDALAAVLAQMIFSGVQQCGSDSRALSSWQNSHAAQMAFIVADFASDGSDDVNARNRNEYAHFAQSLLDGFGRENCVGKSFGRVLLAIRSEGCGEASEDCWRIMRSGSADSERFCFGSKISIHHSCAAARSCGVLRLRNTCGENPADWSFSSSTA